MRIERWLKSSVLLALRRPEAVFLALAGVLAIGVSGLVQLRQSVRTEDQLDSRSQASVDLSRLHELFPSDANIGFILRPRAEFSREELCGIVQEVNRIG